MTNEMKNVPALRFPEFDGDWEEKKLKDISNKGMYGIGASATEFDGENVYVRITDINESSRKINNDKLTSPDRLDKKYLLNENDVLFARTGASTGKTYIHKHYDRDKNYYFAGFLIKFEFKNNYLANFIFQNTLTKRFENWVSVMSVRSGQPGINSEEYGKLKMRFPSKVEQNKIGDFFSKLDRQIELEEQKLEKLEEQKKSYMQKIFYQELRFKDENGNNYPEWEEKKLGDLISEISIKTKTNNQYTLLSSTKNGLVSQEEYFRKQIGSKDNTGYKILKLNQMVISPQNLWLGNINFNDQFEIGIVSPSYRIYEFNSKVTFQFLKYLLKTSRYIYEYGQASEQGASVVRRNLNLDLFYEIKVNLPKLVEQEKIGNFFKKIDKSIDKQFNKVELLKERKKGFLQKMFV